MCFCRAWGWITYKCSKSCVKVLEHRECYQSHWQVTNDLPKPALQNSQTLNYHSIYCAPTLDTLKMQIWKLYFQVFGTIPRKAKNKAGKIWKLAQKEGWPFSTKQKGNIQLITTDFFHGLSCVLELKFWTTRGNIFSIQAQCSLEKSWMYHWNIQSVKGAGFQNECKALTH